MTSIDEQLKIITKGVEEIIGLEELKKKLGEAEKQGRPLIAKLGLDPSAPDIHLGHAVVLRKLKQLQDLGHKAVIIIGDMTGMVGDPTGKSKTRKQLTPEQVAENAETYKKQIFRILDEAKTQVLFNSQWLSKLEFAEVLNLASKITVARMLEREDFKRRFESHEAISLHEFFYPLMQAFDSVALMADIEFGGTDQKFNILMGRSMQREFGQDAQVAIFMPILEGTDGRDKMSKSLNNYIGIDEKPEDMYGKVMSIPDNIVIKYFQLATDIHPDEIEKIRQLLDSSSVNPRDIKMRLAGEITSLYHGGDAAVKAEEHFVRLFQRKEVPEEIPNFVIGQDLHTEKGADIVKVIVACGAASSSSEARRLISQGAVRINGIKLQNAVNVILKQGDIIGIGKRFFIRVSIKGK
ncbi:MAG: tyrosine--tRNA ligase [Bacillota bacterium]|nr:tyrosine--tRNA ligase [Bacillota bacterium]